MDQNAIVIILMLALIVLIALLLILRPWYRRSMAEKKLKDEAKQDRIEEIAAEKIARKYTKKGRL